MKGTTDFLRAWDEIERDKGVSKEIIFDSLEKALLKSYEKNFGEYENVKINNEKEFIGYLKSFDGEKLTLEIGKSSIIFSRKDIAIIKSQIEI